MKKRINKCHNVERPKMVNNVMTLYTKLNEQLKLLHPFDKLI